MAFAAVEMKQPDGRLDRVPEEWLQALSAMQQSISEASAAMRLLTAAITDLKPLVDGVQALRDELANHGGASITSASSGETAPAADSSKGLRQYVLTFKANGRVNMVRVHAALESLEHVESARLSDYGFGTAELVITTNTALADLPLAAAFEAAFQHPPRVEETDDGLLITLEGRR
ncbi:MAG: hypothetical protein GEU28_12155 [Dehalococcoidia bacterium]|nr:hypothetical protein [Dehalococcoidia bacterium]